MLIDVNGCEGIKLGKGNLMRCPASRAFAASRDTELPCAMVGYREAMVIVPSVWLEERRGLYLACWSI